MATPRRLVRIALELEEQEAQAMQALLDEYNKLCFPMKLNRSDMIRSAIQEKLALLKAQLERFKKQGSG